MLHENSREDLIDVLLKNLLEISFNKELKEKIINELKGRIDEIVSLNLFNNPQNIEMLNETQLYFVLKAFSFVYRDKEHNPKEYFKGKDISLYESQPLIKKEKNNIIEIHNINKIEDDLYFCDKLNIDEIIRVTESGFLTYDPRVQRSLKVVQKGDEFIRKIWLSKKSVNEIADKIVKNKYFINAITWNIMKYPDGRERKYFQYDEENKILRVEASSEFLLQIIDGWHRTMGMVLAKQKDLNLKDRFMQLRVTHYTMEKANEFINQEAKMNKFTVSKQNSLKNTEENMIVKQLDTYGTEDTNLLCGRIAIELAELKIDKYMTFSSLSYLIKNNFNLGYKDMISRGRLVEYLIDFFNIIITLNQERFDFKNKDLAISQNILCAMTTIAGELYGKNSWKNTFISFIENFNWENEKFKNYSLGLSYAKFKELGDILLNEYLQFKKEEAVS